jgi:hypothetical protein
MAYFYMFYIYLGVQLNEFGLNEDEEKSMLLYYYIGIFVSFILAIGLKCFAPVGLGLLIYVGKLQLDYFHNGHRSPFLILPYINHIILLYFTHSSIMNIGVYNTLVGLNMTFKEVLNESEECEKFGYTRK